MEHLPLLLIRNLFLSKIDKIDSWHLSGPSLLTNVACGGLPSAGQHCLGGGGGEGDGEGRGNEGRMRVNKKVKIKKNQRCSIKFCPGL